jgi:hypothetical protein
VSVIVIPVLYQSVVEIGSLNQRNWATFLLASRHE